MLPHNHVGEDNCCKISDVKKTTLAEIIRFTLSHDLGANHLEEYEKCNSNVISFSDFHTVLPIIRPMEFSPITISSTIKIFTVTNSGLNSQYFYSGSGLRAPPYRS